MTTNSECWLAGFSTRFSVGACAFEPDSNTIVAGDEIGRMYFLRLVEAAKTKPLVSDTKIRILSREEQEKSMAAAPLWPEEPRAVFISYARADNESPNPKGHWLDRFIEFVN